MRSILIIWCCKKRHRRKAGRYNTVKHIYTHIKKYLPLVALSIVFLAMQAICNLMMPNLMSDIVNTGIQDYAMQIANADGAAAEALKSQQMQYILTVGFRMLLVAVATVAVDLGIHLVNSFSGTGMSRDLRRAVFSKVESFSSHEFSEFSTASLITRTTNDVQQIQMLFTMGLRMIFYAPIMGVGAVFMAIEKAPSMAWINVLTVVAVTVLMTINFLLMSSKFKVLQTIVDRLNLTARESLTGILVVRAFSKQQHEEEKFDSVNREYADTNLFINRVMSVIMPTLTLLQNLIPVLIIVVCADKIAQSTMQVGDMMAFIQYSATIMQSFMMISMMFIMIPRARVSIARISEVLSKENSIVETEKPVEAKFEKCTLEFDNVSFKYPDGDEYALENVSFTSNPGEVTAIIGSTGCGKSSLIQLIPRLYEATDGAVKINGIDVRNFRLTDLRELISYVPQKSQLFSGTIKSNLFVGDENATQQDIENAAKIAQAYDFIMEKEEQFDDPISQGGTNLSGGQRQRMAIARALVKNAPICIFDDSFSALDFKTDANLRKALRENLSEANIIIVGQRVASIMEADRILVMDDGRVVGQGTHQELLESCTAYQEIAYSQLSKEEM